MLMDILREANNDSVPIVSNPELIIGLVGPIGVDLSLVSRAISRVLAELKYQSEEIRIMDYIDNSLSITKIDDTGYFERYKSLINRGNDFRRLANSPTALSGLSILAIRQEREKKTGSSELPSLGLAYILRQFKRPEEIELMRRIYGRKFVLVSVFGSESDRRRKLIDRIRSFDATPREDHDCEKQAIDLIQMDFNQKDDDNGQRISEVFHLGDVFVDGINYEDMNTTVDRFFKALFGYNKASPTKDEYGLYIAAAASYRSADLSRQVGAAIFSEKGEVITLGCNEVPKARGGTYWTDDEDDPVRDIEVGVDPNHSRKSEIVFDFVRRLKKEGLLSTSLNSLESENDAFQEVYHRDTIQESQVMDIIEYGRIIHAEMSAISDAARLGRAVAGSTLYCTTFPCHLCAKHIVAAGIQRVVFLEPYPKSYTRKLHADSITLDGSEVDKVQFVPFIGISPRRYRDIFEKKKRKGSDGKARNWYDLSPVPRIEDRSSAYIANELPAVFAALSGLLGGSGQEA